MRKFAERAADLDTLEARVKIHWSASHHAGVHVEKCCTCIMSWCACPHVTVALQKTYERQFGNVNPDFGNVLEVRQGTGNGKGKKKVSLTGAFGLSYKL